MYYQSKFLLLKTRNKYNLHTSQQTIVSQQKPHVIVFNTIDGIIYVSLGSIVL